MRILGAILILAAGVLAQERQTTECEICGGTVYQTPKTYVSGDVKYIYMYDRDYKKYCTRCQRDVNNGKIDPSAPPGLGPRDDEENEVSDNPYSRHADRVEPRKKHATAEEESGFGALKWVAVIVVVLGVAFRFFLK